MEKFTVKRLAEIARISVRTLHHYDEIGLLKPAHRADSGYRYYAKEELLRLQQILCYRELDMPLNDIARVLDEPDFDILKALECHKSHMNNEMQRFKKIIQSINKTILDLKNKQKMVSYEEMYEGFSREEATRNENEIIEKYGRERLDESKKNIQALTKDQFAALKQEGEDINLALAKEMELHLPADAPLQALVARHYAIINQYYNCPADIYRGLGNMYVSDERFTAVYDGYKPGMANYLKEAIDIFCNKQEENSRS